MLRVILWAALLAGVGAGVGLGVAKFTTPIYEARATLLASGVGADASAARGEALTLLRSNSLFQHAVTVASQTHPELKSKRLPELLPGHDAVQGEGGSALELKVQSPDPKLAADVAKDIVTQYNESAKNANSTNTAEKRSQLSRDTAAAKTRVDAAQKSIEALKVQSRLPNVDIAIQNAATYQANLAQQRDTDQNQLQAVKNKLSGEQAKLTTMAETTTGAVVEAPDPKLQADIKKLQELQAERVDLLENWLPTSEKVKGVDVKIKAQQDAIAAEHLSALTVQRKETQPNPARQALERDIAQDQAHSSFEPRGSSLTEVAKAQTRQDRAASKLPADEAKMLDGQRELDLATAKYKALRASSDDLDVKGLATQLPLLSTFMTIEPPTVPVWPDTNLMISVGAAIGLVLGIMVGISLTARSEEYEPRPQLPAGPVLPELSSGISAPPLPAPRRGDSLAALSRPNAVPAEAYRFMVFSMLNDGEDPTKTVLFTGVSSDSLCSEAAAQFAIAMSQSGVRTLLADCNLRNHGLTEAFGFKGKSGISDMLSRTMLPAAGNDLVLATEHPDLYFMPSGSEEGEGLSGFPNLQITGLVQELKERADVKVLNTPACAVVADAPRLVRFADNICLVATKLDRSRGLVAKAHEILKRAGAADVNVLVIDKEESRDSFLG